MDFQLTDEQRMLRRTLRDLVEREIKPRAAEWDKRGELPWANIRRLAELGVTGLTIPARYGGAGQTLLEGVFAIEEVARGCPNTALALIAGTGVVSLAIAQYGTEAQKQKYLPSIAAGTAVSAICMTEPTAGSATSQVQTNARRQGDGYVVTGRKCMISRGGLAEYYLVLTRFDGQPGLDGVGAVILDRATPGLSFGKPEDTLGFRGVPATDMIMEECPVPPEHVLVGAGGFRKMMTAFNAQRCLNPAISLGIGQAALDEALAYVQKRELYGHPIADFQGIRWQLADMATKLEAARLLVYRAAANAARGFPSRLESSMGKLFANEMALEVTDLAVQLHGGYGFSREFPLERLLREARGMALGGGPPQLQRNVIAVELLKRGFPAWI
ncbi:MAG: acyl-CoA dehydrogenase family protein [Candidatus Rokubacteria bacterium]|nr:acyl-CoA dehydrogenase family protein [Candidatus Rokubacteria bacterium]